MKHKVFHSFSFYISEILGILYLLSVFICLSVFDLSLSFCLSVCHWFAYLKFKSCLVKCFVWKPTSSSIHESNQPQQHKAKLFFETIKTLNNKGNKNPTRNLYKKSLGTFKPCNPISIGFPIAIPLRIALRNATLFFTAISARFVAHIPLPLAPNLRLKVSFFRAHQQCGILGAIKVYFSHKFHILLTI